MSKSWRLPGTICRILMKAPRVPVSGRGAGRKYGSEASTP
jgi:hypothetical protein